MKKIIVLVGAVFLLSGCGSQQVNLEQQQKDVNLPQNVAQKQPPVETNISKSPLKNDECTSPEEIEKMQNERDSHNKQVAVETKYSNSTLGVSSIDFGKYGFKVIDNGEIGFGPWIIVGGPCAYENSQLYNLTFTEKRLKEEIVKDVKKNEYGDIDEPGWLKFREVKRINDFDAVVWEEGGAYPTYKLFFEVPGKIRNYHIETDSIQSDKEDYQNVVNILKTLKIEK